MTVFQNKAPQVPGYPQPPAVADLIKLLPQAGAVFPHADRGYWLRAIERVFDVVYLPKDDTGSST